jgi:hypothetical protein
VYDIYDMMDIEVGKLRKKDNIITLELYDFHEL